MITKIIKEAMKCHRFQFNCLLYRRMINTEEKAKVVATVLGDIICTTVGGFEE